MRLGMVLGSLAVGLVSFTAFLVYGGYVAGWGCREWYGKPIGYREVVTAEFRQSEVVKWIPVGACVMDKKISDNGEVLLDIGIYDRYWGMKRYSVVAGVVGEDGTEVDIGVCAIEEEGEVKNCRLVKQAELLDLLNEDSYYKLGLLVDYWGEWRWKGLQQFARDKEKIGELVERLRNGSNFMGLRGEQPQLRIIEIDL